MPEITNIKLQKKRARASIYLDGEFGFGIDLENLVKLRLKVGQVLAEKDIEIITKKAEVQKTYEKILKFATLRPRSRKEIEDRLRRYKVPESLYKYYFSKLKRLELVNDKAFSKWWIEQRSSFRPRGKRALMVELRQKGIDRVLIDEVLGEERIDERKMAREILEKAEYKWKKMDKLEARQKMSAFLARKGFGWEIIKELLKER